MDFNIKQLGTIISTGSDAGTKYLDQLSDTDKYVPSVSFSRYLRRTYGLSPAEYYNLVMYGDKYKIHECEVCGNPTEFHCMSAGFRRTCSRKCASILGARVIAPVMKDYNSPVKVASRKKLKELFESGQHPMAGVEVHARSRMTDFIRKGDPDAPSWFYVAISNDDRLKYGITDDPVAYNNSKHMYKKVHPLIKGTRSTVAKLEYLYKVHFNSRIEYFDLSNYSVMTDWIIKCAKDNNLGTFNDYPSWGVECK